MASPAGSMISQEQEGPRIGRRQDDVILLLPVVIWVTRIHILWLQGVTAKSLNLQYYRCKLFAVTPCKLVKEEKAEHPQNQVCEWPLDMPYLLNSI